MGITREDELIIILKDVLDVNSPLSLGRLGLTCLCVYTKKEDFEHGHFLFSFFKVNYQTENFDLIDDYPLRETQDHPAKEDLQESVTEQK